MSKYKEFLNKKKYIAQNWGMKCESEHLWSFVEEILEQFKLLEDNLEWRKKVEAREWGDDDTDYFESDEEREEWNNLMRQKIEESKRTEPCTNLVQKILKNTPESANELFQLLLDYKFNSSETRFEKVEEGIGEKE